MAKHKRPKSAITADRISGLPQPIIHQILSLLPTVDATRTSALSKTFYSSWKYFPVIDLKYLFIKTSSSNGCSVQEFADLVNRTLRSRNLVKDLSINAYTGPESSPVCISLPPATIADLGFITKLNLVHVAMYFNRIDARMPLLESLTINACSGLKHFNFSSSNIKSITIDFCAGLQSVIIESSSLEKFYLHRHYQYECKILDISECKSLKDLGLCVADIEDSWITENISSFSHLENLELIECNWLDNPRLVNENLKSLYVSSESGAILSMEIEATNLQSLSLDVLGASNIGVISFMHLRDLTLDTWLPKEFLIDFLKEQVPKFILLETLTINAFKDLNGIKINNKHLTRLVLYDDECHYNIEDHELGEITLKTPKLASLEYCGFVKTFHVLSLGDLVNAKLEIQRSTHKEYFVKLWNMIQIFRHSIVLKLSFHRDKDFIFSRRLRRMLVSPIWKLAHVELELSTSFRMIPIKLVESLLWLWPSLKTICFVSREDYSDDTKSIKVQYERITTEEEVHPKKCWQFVMKTIEFNNVDIAQRADIEKQFMENAKFLKP